MIKLSNNPCLDSLRYLKKNLVKPPCNPNKPNCERIKANETIVSRAPISPVSMNFGMSKATLMYPSVKPEYIIRVLIKPCRAIMPIVESDFRKRDALKLLNFVTSEGL